MNLTSNFSGTPPECYHEYLDLFTELRKPDDQSLIQTPFGGRYCGKIPPRQEPMNKRTVTETSFVILGTIQVLRHQRGGWVDGVRK